MGELVFLLLPVLGGSEVLLLELLVCLLQGGEFFGEMLVRGEQLIVVVLMGLLLPLVCCVYNIFRVGVILGLDLFD